MIRAMAFHAHVIRLGGDDSPRARTWNEWIPHLHFSSGEILIIGEAKKDTFTLDGM